MGKRNITKFYLPISETPHSTICKILITFEHVYHVIEIIPQVKQELTHST